MKVKFEFISGRSETKDVREILAIKVADGDNLENVASASEEVIKKYIDRALMLGGIFEVSWLPIFSLIKSVEINSHTIEKVTLIKDEQKPTK